MERGNYGDTVEGFESGAGAYMYIYIYVYLRDTSYDGRFVETMAGEQRIGYIDVRFIIAVKFRRRERLISLCERSSPILRDEMISLIAFSYIYIYIYMSLLRRLNSKIAHKPLSP